MKTFTVELSEKQRDKIVAGLKMLPEEADDLFDEFDTSNPLSLINMFNDAEPGDVTNSFVL